MRTYIWLICEVPSVAPSRIPTGILLGIPSGIYSGVPSGILPGIFPGISFSIYPEDLTRFLRDYFSAIISRILPEISSGSFSRKFSRNSLQGSSRKSLRDPCRYCFREVPPNNAPGIPSWRCSCPCWDSTGSSFRSYFFWDPEASFRSLFTGYFRSSIWNSVFSSEIPPWALLKIHSEVHS